MSFGWTLSSGVDVDNNEYRGTSLRQQLINRTLPLKRPPVLIATINPDWGVGGYLNMLH